MVMEANAISGAYQTYLNTLASQLGVSVTLIAGIITLGAIWTLIWKGTALWKSSQKKQPIWFIVLLVVNTFGILEILYIFWFSKFGKKQPNAKEKQQIKGKKK